MKPTPQQQQQQQRQSLQQPIAFGLDLLSTHLQTIATDAIGRGRATHLRLASECIASAPPGSVETAADAHRVLRSGTTIQNPERVCDEIHGLLTNQMSRDMKMAMQYRTAIMATRTLSQLLDCTERRASELHAAAHQNLSLIHI